MVEQGNIFLIFELEVGNFLSFQVRGKNIIKPASEDTNYFVKS